MMQVACGPKLIMAPLDPEKLAAYHLTDLERTAKRDILFEADLGIPISLLDTAAYAVPDQAPPLAPEDAALLDEVRGVPCMFRLPGSIVACPTAPQASSVPAGWHAALTSKVDPDIPSEQAIGPCRCVLHTGLGQPIHKGHLHAVSVSQLRGTG